MLLCISLSFLTFEFGRLPRSILLRRLQLRKPRQRRAQRFAQSPYYSRERVFTGTISRKMDNPHEKQLSTGIWIIYLFYLNVCFHLVTWTSPINYIQELNRIYNSRRQVPGTLPSRRNSRTSRHYQICPRNVSFYKTVVIERKSLGVCC